MPHRRTVVRIAKEHKMKSILSEPRRNDFESQALPCLWSSGSNNLHSLHILAIPPDDLKKSSLLSIANTMLWSSFLFLFIAMIMSVISASLGCSFLFVYYITNHCCFIIVVSATVAMFPLQGMYIEKDWWRVLFFPRIVMKVHRPIPDGSCPFYRTANKILFKMNIAVPPSLHSLSSIWYLIQMCRSLFYFLAK